jgi:hypothetical protein
MDNTPSTAGGPAVEAPRYAPVFWWINAVVAWCAVGLSFTLSASGYYVDAVNPAKPTILGNVPDGIDTPLERILDWITYFTILSNIVVAVVLTALAIRPALFVRRDLTGTVWRTLRLDSVLMIVITGLVYNLLLAEGGKVGWDALSNTLLHWVTPLLTLIVWIIAGPRGLISIRILALSLVLPVLWATFALLRGQAVGAYPYPFLDLSTNSLGSVLGFIGAIIVLAILMGLLLLAIDAGLRRATRQPTRDIGTATADATASSGP